MHQTHPVDRGDGAGELDGLVWNNGASPERGRAWLLRNEAAGGSWLRVSTVGTVGNRDGIGAVVTVTVDGVSQRQTVRPAKRNPGAPERRAVM